MRLDKFLSNENIGSRKGGRHAGAQRCRRRQRTSRAQKAISRSTPKKDEITVNGKPVRYSAFVYIMLYKPSGVLTATRDSRAETVLDLLPPGLSAAICSPAGRLDKDTTGLLVFNERRRVRPPHVGAEKPRLEALPRHARPARRRKRHRALCRRHQKRRKWFALPCSKSSKDDPHIAWTEIREGKVSSGQAYVFSVRQDRHGPSPRIHRRFNARSHTYARRSENSRSERRSVGF